MITTLSLVNLRIQVFYCISRAFDIKRLIFRLAIFLHVFLIQQRNSNAATETMFQAINDGDVNTLREILKEQGSQLNNIRTVT